MTVTAAYLEGWRRTARAPLLWVALATAAIAAATGGAGGGAVPPGAWWPFGLHAPLAPASDLHGVGAGFGAAAQAAVLPDVPALVQLALGARALAAAFLLGGVYGRLAQPREARSGLRAFAASCGAFLPRFLRLGLAAGMATAALGAAIAADAGVLSLGAIAALALLLLVVDCGEIRMVVEDRRSAIGALAAGARFARAHPAAAALLVLNVVAIALLAGAADAAAASAHVAWRHAGRAAALAAAVAVQLQYAAARLALVQARLA